MRQRLVVTGASGYIGARFVERAQRRGCEVAILGSRPGACQSAAVHWNLGERPPCDVLAGATALVHLAHDWSSDRRDGAGRGNASLTGAEILARDAGVPRFVFASSTSARANAANAYGKIKFGIEERLNAMPPCGHTQMLCVRIGLVYGGPERAQFGLMCRLVSLPVLPMIGLDREVRMPLGRRAATKLFRVLSSALAVATVYFPGRYTVNEVTICNPGDNLRLEIRGGTSSGFDKLSDAIRRRLRRIWRTLGAIALPGTTLATAGTDAHFGGLFPMGNPAAHGTSRFGELNAKPGLFVADGSVLPSIPSKFTRLTIMANADRIGRHVASLG